MNLDIAYLKFAWKLQKATCTLNIKWVGELVPSVRKQTAAKLQCGPVVRALALRSGDPGFKTRSYHSLNLFLVVPGSTSQLHLYKIANWFASGQLGFLTVVVVVVFCCFVDCFIGPEKPLWGSGQLSMYCIVLYCIG